MDKKKDTGGYRPPQATVVIRLIAGGYLVYLSYDLFKLYLVPGEGGKLYQLLCAAFFFLVGAGLAAWSARKFIKGDYVKYGESAQEETPDGDAAEEAAAMEETAEKSNAQDTEIITNKIQEDDGNDRS